MNSGKGGRAPPNEKGEAVKTKTGVNNLAKGNPESLNNCQLCTVNCGTVPVQLCACTELWVDLLGAI